jgi:electron transport complex protein RnfB
MPDVYERLAARLDQLPNGFPSTESGVELKILRKIFTPEEAEMALKIKPLPETAESMAERLSMSLTDLQPILDNMVKKGQIGTTKMRGQRVYMLFPFAVGIYEFQLNRLDKELVDLVEEYFPTLFKSLGNFEPDFFRVIPVNTQIKAEHQVRPYEDVRQMIEEAESFQVSDCICRKEKALQGEPCEHTLQMCLSFSKEENAYEEHSLGRIITREEAFEVLKRAEEEGLVHQTYNIHSDHFFICNCCPCCCGVIRGMREFKAPHMMAGSNFVALIDRETCEACGVCADERCPVGAITEDNGSYMVQPEQCIGCGVCTTTCPTESITLTRKHESERDQPPANLMEWYFKRARSRGIRMPVE